MLRLMRFMFSLTVFSALFITTFAQTSSTTQAPLSTNQTPSPSTTPAFANDTTQSTANGTSQGLYFIENYCTNQSLAVWVVDQSGLSEPLIIAPMISVRNITKPVGAENVTFGITINSVSGVSNYEWAQNVKALELIHFNTSGPGPNISYWIDSSWGVPPYQTNASTVTPRLDMIGTPNDTCNSCSDVVRSGGAAPGPAKSCSTACNFLMYFCA